MAGLLVVLVTGFVVIAAATVVGPRFAHGAPRRPRTRRADAAHDQDVANVTPVSRSESCQLR